MNRVTSKRKGVCGKEIYIRCLLVFTTAPHNNVGRRGFRPQVPLVDLVSLDSLLEKAKSSAGHTANIATGVRGYNSEKALACFLGKVWFL
jgi:hypothetical protein